MSKLFENLNFSVSFSFCDPRTVAKIGVTDPSRAPDAESLLRFSSSSPFRSLVITVAGPCCIPPYKQIRLFTSKHPSLCYLLRLFESSHVSFLDFTDSGGRARVGLRATRPQQP